MVKEKQKDRSKEPDFGAWVVSHNEDCSDPEARLFTSKKEAEAYAKLKNGKK